MYPWVDGEMGGGRVIAYVKDGRKTTGTQLSVVTRKSDTTRDNDGRGIWRDMISDDGGGTDRARSVATARDISATGPVDCVPRTKTD